MEEDGGRWEEGRVRDLEVGVSDCRAATGLSYLLIVFRGVKSLKTE